MKRIKQLAAIMLSVILAATLAAPAFVHAAEGRFTEVRGAIKLEGIDPDQTYRIYKILDLVSFADSDTETDHHADDRYAYAIAENSLWLPFIRDHADIFEVEDVALDPVENQKAVEDVILAFTRAGSMGPMADSWTYRYPMPATFSGGRRSPVISARWPPAEPPTIRSFLFSALPETGSSDVSRYRAAARQSSPHAGHGASPQRR